jgi:hypothetical protein
MPFTAVYQRPAHKPNDSLMPGVKNVSRAYQPYFYELPINGLKVSPQMVRRVQASFRPEVDHKPRRLPEAPPYWQIDIMYRHEWACASAL